MKSYVIGSDFSAYNMNFIRESLNYQKVFGVAIVPEQGFSSRYDNFLFHEFWHMVQGLILNRKSINETINGFDYERIRRALSEGMTQIVEMNAYNKSLDDEDRTRDYNCTVAKTALTLKQNI
jgi:hypothetical protein